MEQVKTIMGEAVQSASPSISEQEAIENASFGKYTYDPMSRMQMSTVSLPGWQGYSTSPNPNGFYGQPMMQQPMGYIGQAMYGYGNNYGLGMNPYVNQYYGYNPYFQQQPVYQQPQQPQYMQIPPLNYRGEYLPTMGYEEKLDDLSYKYWVKEQEQAVENQAKYNNYGYGYYGNMMYNFYNPVRMEANNIVHQMQEEARENRIQFNIKLGKLAANLAYGPGKYDESKLEELYRGKTIENPMGVSMSQIYEQNRFANCVPFDNSGYYQAFHAQVSAQHNAIIRPDSNLKEAFDRAGELWAMYEMEDEMHRRRNLQGTYNSDGYKYFIRKFIAERNQQEDNNHRFGNSTTPSFSVNGSIPAPGSMNIYTSNPRNGGKHVATLPSLDQNGNLNVTLSIPCNFGSMKGSNYVVNENEAAYDKKREEFNRFVDSIPKSIYGGG